MKINPAAGIPGIELPKTKYGTKPQSTTKKVQKIPTGSCVLYDRKGRPYDIGYKKKA